jgi:ADP-ribosylation factor GTPase-activating protein 1
MTCEQENANKPEGLAPSQGGKYVGFGSTPPPAPRRAPGAPVGVDDVTQMLSKGLTQLGSVAGRLMFLDTSGTCVSADNGWC